MRVALAGTLLALSALLLPAPAAAAEADARTAPAARTGAAPRQPLMMAVYPYVDSALLARRMQPLADYFNSQVPGLQLELRVLPREALQAAIAANQIDLVLTNPSHYLELRSRNALTGALATLVRRHGELSTSSSGGAIVVGVDAPLATLSDLRDKRLAAPQGRGLGSYQAQAFELRRVGIDVAEDARLLLVRGQREAVRAVLDGEADAAFVRAGFIDDTEAMAGLDPKRLKVLNEQRLAGYPFAVSTRLYPEWPLLALPHVDRALVRRIAAAALALDAEHPAARAAGIAGFDPPADYLPVEQLARAMRAPPFDQAPPVRLRDVLDQHRHVVIATAVGLLSSAALLLLLLRRNAQLQRGNRELARSRGLLQTVLDTVPVQVWWKDRQGRVLGRNAAAGAAVAQPQAESAAQAALEAGVLAGGQPQLGVESPWQRPDGSRGWRRSSVVPLRDLDGSVIGVLGTHDDVSALREQQQAVLDTRNRLQATLDALPDLLFEIDERGTYHFAHSPVAGLLAAPLDSLIGRTIDEVLPADVVQLCRELMAQCKLQGVTPAARYRLELPVGVRWFDATMARKAGADGAVPHFVMIVRDVTDRRAAEIELEAHRERLQDLVAERTAELSAARDAAEQASRAKSAFLANTSHEIRTPLNAVIGMAHLLRRSPLNAQQTAWLNALQNAGEHLLEVLNAILDLSKIEAGKLTLAPARTDLRALVASVRSMVAARAADKDLALRVDVPARLPPVLADATRLQQALLNLVHNAISSPSAARSSCGCAPSAGRTTNWTCASRSRTPASASTPT